MLLAIIQIFLFLCYPFVENTLSSHFLFLFFCILLEEKSGKKYSFFSYDFLTQSCVLLFARSPFCTSIEPKRKMQVTNPPVLEGSMFIIFLLP